MNHMRRARWRRERRHGVWSIRLLEVGRWIVVWWVRWRVHRVEWRILRRRRRSVRVGVITLRRMGENARGAITTGWEVPARNETGDFGGRKVVHASRRMTLAHSPRWRGWEESASVGHGRERGVDCRIVWISIWWGWRIEWLLGVVSAIVGVGEFSGRDTVGQRLDFCLKQKI